MNWGEVLVAVLKYVGVSAFAILVGILLALRYQNEIQKYSVWFWKLIRFFWKKAEKKIVSNDIEGRVNSFSKSLSKEMVNFDPVGVEVQWIDEGESPAHFLTDARLVVRMRQHSSQNKNFVYASMVFVSACVLAKAKKYISKSQSESLDIFVGKKLFEKEKPMVAQQFFDDYFSPKMEKEKVAELVEKYNLIDKVALFFPVLVQELTFLGEKVFWRKREAQIMAEVNHLIDFLQDYANREIGDETTLNNFQGAYCRCGIMLIGKFFKRELGDTQPYTSYIESLANNMIENIYIVGPATPANIAFITTIVQEVEQKGVLEQYAKPQIHPALVKSGGRRKPIKSYILTLRNPNAVRYFDKEYQKKYIEQSATTPQQS